MKFILGLLLVIGLSLQPKVYICNGDSSKKDNIQQREWVYSTDMSLKKKTLYLGTEKQLCDLLDLIYAEGSVVYYQERIK